MGTEKYKKKILQAFDNSAIVDYRSINRIINHKKNIKQYTKQLVRNLKKEGRIKKLAKGYYTKHDEVSLAVLCFQPAYLGLQDALSFHNLWEQETIPIIITSKKIRQGIRKIMGINVLIRRIDGKYMFGHELEKVGDFYLYYSDIEKTFIDMIYFNETISDEAKKNFKEKIDKKKLQKYLLNIMKKKQLLTQNPIAIK